MDGKNVWSMAYIIPVTFLAAIVYPIINPEDNLGMLDSDVCFYFDKVQELGRVKTPLTLVTQHDTITWTLYSTNWIQRIDIVGELGYNVDDSVDDL